MDIMCTADTATMVHSDTCSLLHGETLGKPKKTRKTKGSYPDPSKTIENNQKNKKKTTISATLGELWTPYSLIIAEIVDLAHQLSVLLQKF